MASKNEDNKRFQAWIEARKRHHLSHAHVHMARELGMNPTRLGKIDNHDQEPWKVPLPAFIEQLYEKRFGKTHPGVVMTIEEYARASAAKQAERKAKKQARKAARAAEPAAKADRAETSAAQLAEMMEQAPVDAHADSKDATRWLAMFQQHLALPFDTSVLGVRVTVEAVDLREGRIVVVCKRGKQRLAVGIADLPLTMRRPDGAEWLDGYRSWLVRMRSRALEE